MTIVERGNVVLRIDDEDVQRYLDKGYNVTDGHGHILQRAMPQDVGELQQLVVKYEKEIAELKAKLAESVIAPKEKVTESVVETVKPKRGRPKKVEE